MTRICHVTSAHNTTDVRIFEKECVSLAKKENNQVYLVGPGNNRIEKKVTVIGMGDKPNSRIERIFQFSRNVIKRAIEIDADIYHLHDPELLLYVKKLKKMGKKIIFDAHENYYKQITQKEYINKYLRNFIAMSYKFVEAKMCYYIDAAIFPCVQDGKHPYEEYVDIYEFIDNVPIINDDMNFKNIARKNQVCCTGSLTRDRGIEVLVDACYKANIKLVLAGNMSNEFKECLFRKKEASIIDYKGICTRDEVMSIIAESAVGASNILWVGQYPYAQNLPTKVYEYMMMKTPFIISNFAYFKSTVNQYKCGIVVDPNDSDMIANVIQELIDDPEKGIVMGENGYNTIKKKFNWNIEEAKLYKLYEKVLNC